MSKKLSDNTQLVGFTYRDVHSPLRSPDGAFITETKVNADANAIMSIDMRKIPISELHGIVKEGKIKDLRVKDGELVLKAMRKTNRKASTAGTIVETGAGLAASSAALKGVAAAKGAVAASSAASTAAGVVADVAYVEVGSAAIAATETAGLIGASSAVAATEAAVATGAVAAETAVAAGAVAAETAVATGVVAAETTAVATVGTTAVAAGGAAAAGGVAATAAAVLPPLAISLAASAAVGVTIKAFTGLATRHKIYEYTPMRMITAHAELAEKSLKHIAVCVAGFQKTKEGLTLTLFAYGIGLRDYVINLLRECPELHGGATVPNGNITCIVAPYRLLSNPNFYSGYNLMFNTMNLHDSEIRGDIVKATKIEAGQLGKIAKVLDTMTENSMKVPIAEVSSSSTKPVSVPNKGIMSNIQAYCKKYGMTETHFRETEAERLCTVLGCDEAGLEENLSQLLA